MERISRKERRLVQGARDRIMRDKRCPIEFVCCGACDYLIKVYLGEDGSNSASEMRSIESGLPGAWDQLKSQFEAFQIAMRQSIRSRWNLTYCESFAAGWMTVWMILRSRRW